MNRDEAVQDRQAQRDAYRVSALMAKGYTFAEACRLVAAPGAGRNARKPRRGNAPSRRRMQG